MPQIIPLVVTAITAVTSAVVAAGPLAVAAFNAANVIGAAALANEAFKAVQPQVKSSSTALEWNADPNAPNRFAFGRVGGPGNIIHNATYGPDKMFVGFVGVMSASGPIKSWQAFKADDAFVSFDASGKAINTEYANEMYLGRQRGLQPEPSYLPSPSGLKGGAAMPRWGASYKLSGKAAYIYTLAENSKRSAFKGKVPTGIHYIEGLYCYDPRFDDTFPGGTGPCRIDDPTTWVYSTNAYIHALNWNIGRWEGEARGFTPARYGVPYASMKVGGIGATPEGIDFSGYVEAANVFDENAWASAAWPDADQSKAAVLDSFLQAGGGIYAERQGKISCLHRAAPRTSVVTITADDTAGTIEYDTTTSLLERINTIRPEYWSEAHGWQMVATDEVTSSVWREEDGQGVAVTRSKGLAYNYVPQSKQARELAALQIAHTREGIRGTAPLRHYLDLEVGDCFTFEVPEAVLNGQKCIVLNVDPDLENDIIHVTFASESDGKYPFAFGQADAPPPAPALQPADNTVSPPLPGDWTITPRPPAPGGGQLPGFDLGGVVSNATATAVIVEHGPTATGPWTQAYQGPPTVTNIPIDGLQPGATYYIAVQYQRDHNYSERYVYGPYTAPDLIAGGLAPESPIWGQLNDLTKQALRTAIEAAQALLDEEQRRQIEVEDILDRLGLGFLLDPVTRTALIKSETVVDGVAPGGLPETLVQMSARLVAADAANTANTAQALITAEAKINALRSESYAAFATYNAMGDAIAANALVIRGQVTAEIATATANLVSSTQMGTAISNSEVSLRNWTNGRISESVTGLASTAYVAGSLATAKGQWEAYADDAAARSIVGLDSVAAREAALGAAVLSLQSWSDGRFASGAALLAVQSTANNASSTAALALSAANGNEAYAALTVDAGNRLTAMRINGVTRAIEFLSDSVAFLSPGGGERTEYRGGSWHVYSPADSTRTRYGKAFGGTQKLVWWTGPIAVPEGGEAKANAYVYISMNTEGGPRFGGSDVPTGGSSGGSGVIGWSGIGSAVPAPAKSLPAGTLLRDMQFTVGGGSINNAAGVGVLVYVYAGVTVIGQANLFIEASGDVLPDGSWQASYASFQLPNMASPASGSVGFSLQIMSVTGGSIVRPMEMTGSIFAVIPL
nr:hypothetical protein [Brevundimonas naejangsanensis]